MRREIKLTVDIPDVGATESEIREFIEFELHYSGRMSLKNSLCEETINVIECSIEN